MRSKFDVGICDVFVGVDVLCRSTLPYLLSVGIFGSRRGVLLAQVVRLPVVPAMILFPVCMVQDPSHLNGICSPIHERCRNDGQCVLSNFSYE